MITDKKEIKFKFKISFIISIHKMSFSPPKLDQIILQPPSQLSLLSNTSSDNTSNSIIGDTIMTICSNSYSINSNSRS